LYGREDDAVPIVEGSIRIHSAPSELFALSQDYSLRRYWDPFVCSMRYLDDATEAAPGVRVWVRAWTGLTMTVRYTSFHPPHSTAMTMVAGPWFFRHFAGTWLFKPDSAMGTIVTFRYSFTVRPQWLRRFVEPVIAWVFERDVQARLNGLKIGAERDCLVARLGHEST
jgi:ribosome-associated toxin RatA of RatAB toxin-antitoxin module